MEILRGVANANGGASIRASLEKHCKLSTTFSGEELYILKYKGSGLYKYVHHKSIDRLRNNKLSYIHSVEIELKNIYNSEDEVFYSNIPLKDGSLNIRKYKSDHSVKGGKYSKPNYISNEIVKLQQGIISENAVLEQEIEKLMQTEAYEQIKEMKKFFENKTIVKVLIYYHLKLIIIINILKNILKLNLQKEMKVRLLI